MTKIWKMSLNEIALVVLFYTMILGLILMVPIAMCLDSKIDRPAEAEIPQEAESFKTNPALPFILNPPRTMHTFK